MDNLEQRLVKVFGTVFPDLPADRIPSASQSTTEGWDSIAAITLINLIEEEFEIQMDFDRAAELTSFPEILTYLKGTLSHTAV